MGAGRAEDFEGKDVAGKILLTSGSTRAAYTEGVQRGAIGVLGISVIGPERASDFPNQIVSSSLTAQPNTVAWNLTPAVRNYLASLLLRGETVTIRSTTRSVQRGLMKPSARPE